ncbi:unnamed protein product [Aphanomyces euteiches]|uniref:PPM-type phosphatase domain-containing protein n=1 Tax=Aphanomyces euteiches TaxID=100861 RepID=A0A6G0WTE1_9STRA|nr:hypothetical protein Ae201684_011841 [Aphanomyces euteiches]KAH9089356.1 hypothetical protein Ae201684P_001556 [Aphanomyces euteiches]KAH9157389.1 hypothetical protein AeRB84_000753 [Aphanomyces euteiches]
MTVAWFDGFKLHGLFEGMYASYAVVFVVLVVVIKFALSEISSSDKPRGKRVPPVDDTVLYPYGVAEMQGKRPYMEDRYAVAGKLNGDAFASFYGVFDGHGGDGASEYCVEALCNNITSDPAYPSDPKQALTRGFIKTDSDYIKLADRYHKDDGTTAIGVLVQGNTIHVANVGDSRAVLIKKNGDAVALSVDHKPNRQDERERVNNMGGHVIFWGVWRVEGILAVSRAIGDRMLKPYVIAEPEIVDIQRTDADQAIVLASDGVWDVLSNAEVARLVRQSESPQLAAKTIMEYAYQRGSLDNICALVIDLARGNSGLAPAPQEAKPSVNNSSSGARGLALVEEDTEEPLETDSSVVTAELD